MKTSPSTPWSRLVVAARRAPPSALAGASAECDAPYGFSARVVANARLGSGPSAAAVFERLASRAFGLACVCAVAVAAWGYLPSSAEARSADGTSELFDPVGEVLDATQS